MINTRRNSYLNDQFILLKLDQFTIYNSHNINTIMYFKLKMCLVFDSKNVPTFKNVNGNVYSMYTFFKRFFFEFSEML